jgi:hypothetical protein
MAMSSRQKETSCPAWFWKLSWSSELAGTGHWKLDRGTLQQQNFTDPCASGSEVGRKQDRQKADSKKQKAESRQQTADSRQQKAESRMQKAGQRD